MPVTHGYENAGLERIAQLAFEPAGLKFRQFAEGRPAANLGIVFNDGRRNPSQDTKNFGAVNRRDRFFYLLWNQ
jgi:hypothetical protein